MSAVWVLHLALYANTLVLKFLQKDAVYVEPARLSVSHILKGARSACPNTLPISTTAARELRISDFGTCAS